MRKLLAIISLIVFAAVTGCVWGAGEKDVPSEKAGKPAKKTGIEDFLGINKAERPQGGETRITAERMDLDYERMIAIFEKDVVVEDPELRIESDELRVFFTKTNEVRAVTAMGNVKLKREDMSATASKVIYHRATGEIIMTGRPHLDRPKEGESMEADRISFFIKNGELSGVQAIGRVKMRKMEQAEPTAVKGEARSLKLFPAKQTIEKP